MRPGTDDLDRDFSAQHILSGVEASLRRLRRDTLDLLQLHGPSLAVLYSDETWSALGELVASGKVRYIGMSLKSRLAPAERLAWLQGAHLSAIQTQYGLHDPEGMALLNEQPSRRITVLGRSLFAHGLLFGGQADDDATDHRQRKWPSLEQRVARIHREFESRGVVGAGAMRRSILTHAVLRGAVDVALVGATTRDQVRENAEIMARADEFAGLADVVDEVARSLMA